MLPQHTQHLEGMIRSANELLAAGILTKENTRNICTIARQALSTGIIVKPICPACGGEMADFETDETGETGKRKPRFVCKTKICWKKLVGRGGNGFLKEDQFEDGDFRTGLWNISDLKNADEYKKADMSGNIEQLKDTSIIRDKFR